jgi:hypothetical protein
MEMMKMSVDEFAALVAGLGECSFLIVTIFSLSRNIICCVWEVGTSSV